MKVALFEQIGQPYFFEYKNRLWENILEQTASEVKPMLNFLQKLLSR
jgi:hypothetical protein